jgi:hypothetical protein
VIQCHPDRDSSTGRLDTVQATCCNALAMLSRHCDPSVQEELGQLEQKERQLQEKLETRKKQFHLLVSSIHQMQANSNTAS